MTLYNNYLMLFGKIFTCECTAFIRAMYMYTTGHIYTIELDVLVNSCQQPRALFSTVSIEVFTAGHMRRKATAWCHVTRSQILVPTAAAQMQVFSA